MRTRQEYRDKYKERATELLEKVAEIMKEDRRIQSLDLHKDFELKGTNLYVGGNRVVVTEMNFNSDYRGNINVTARHGYGRGQQDRFYERKKDIFNRVDDIAKAAVDHAILNERNRQRSVAKADQSKRKKKLFKDVFGSDYDWTWHPNDNYNLDVSARVGSETIRLEFKGEIDYHYSKSTAENDEKIKETLEEIEQKMAELNELVNRTTK